MPFIEDKTDSVGQTLPANVFNPFKNSVQNVITDTGGTLIDSDEIQFRQAINSYASIANFYIDTGTATQYVLNPQGSFKTPIDAPTTWNGMLIRFRPINNNTGIVTLRLAGLNGGLAFNILREDRTAIQANDFSTYRDAILRYDLTASAFLLLTVPIPNASETVAGKIQIATTAQVTAGMNDTSAMTPAKFIQHINRVKEVTTIVSGSGTTNATGYTIFYDIATGAVIRKKVWGRKNTISPDNGVNITFPLTFTTIYDAQISLVNNGSNIDSTPDSPVQMRNLTLTGVRLCNADALQTVDVWYSIEGN